MDPELPPLRDPLGEEWVGIRLTNPVTEEEIEILEVDPDDEPFVRGRLRVTAGGTGPPLHVHPRHEEWFSVESGRLTVHREGKRRSLGEGERITIPPGIVHGFENPGDSPVVFTGGLRPRSRITHVLSTLFGQAWEGQVREDGSPRFLQAMVFAREMKDEICLASPSYPIQWLLWTLFAPLGRGLGYRATYDRYLRPGFWERTARRFHRDRGA